MSENNVPVNVNKEPTAQRPALQLPTNRALWKFLLLGFITFGIYDIVVMSKISTNINTIASRYDGKKTMHFCLLYFLIAPITLGIGALVWQHKICNRMGNELKRRQIPYNFSAGTFWLWTLLGSLIIVGPFVFIHKFCKAINLLAADYNAKG